MIHKLLLALKLREPTLEDLISKNQALNIKGDKILEKRRVLQAQINKMILEKHNG